MGFIAAGLAVAAIGAGVSAYGASQNAQAQADAAAAASRAESNLYNKWAPKLDTLIKDKEEILYNSGDIFDRYASTGAFGKNNQVPENLRQAQEDFSKLAAGDFSGFESQLRKSMGDALVSTVGRGSPVGAYSQLAADTIMNYRQSGIQTATGLTDFFANQTQNLLATEFGIMDQKFEAGYSLERSKVTGVNENNMLAARTVGMGTMAWGQAGQTIGGAMASYGMNVQGQNNIDNMMLQRPQQSVAAPSRPISARPVGYAQPSSYSPQSNFSDWQEPIGNPTLWGYSESSLLPLIDRTPWVNSTIPGASAVSSTIRTGAYGSMINAGMQVVSGNK
jgi:hypothetical protein